MFKHENVQNDKLLEGKVVDKLLKEKASSWENWQRMN